MATLASRLSTRSLARASARHPWRTVVIWIGVIAVAVGLNAAFLQDGLTTEFTFSTAPESVRGARLLEERLRGPRPINEVIVVRSSGLTVNDDAFEATVTGLFDDVMALGPDVVESGVNYYQFRLPNFISDDRHTVIIPFVMAGTLDQANDNIGGLFALVEEAGGADAFDVYLVGEASVAFETNELSVREIEQGERVGVPMALLILLVLFGAVVAAFVPLVLAALAIVTALGATALVGLFVELSFFVTLMISMIGLATGIDYSLIVVSRFREEMGRGRSKLEAVEIAGATASRTVFFSGLTVVLALAGLLLHPASIFQSLATGAILVVVAAVALTTTLLPAALALLGAHVNALRLPIIGRRIGVAADVGGGFWTAVTRVVMRYPLLSFVAAAGIMVAAALPALDLKTGFNGVDSLPDGVQSKDAFFILEEEFSFGVVSPMEIVIDAPAADEAVLSAIEALRETLAADPDFVGASRVRVNAEGDLTLVSVPVAGEPASDEAIAALKRLRSDYLPAAFAGVDAEILVTGETAFNDDFFEITDRYTPIIFAFVLTLSFVLLTVAFRSIVIPLKAIILNLLSVGAAYGLMVLVFQKGYGADLLGFQTSEMIDAWIPLFLFAVLFGLSMDYHVFLLSRIRERYDQTHDNAESVAYGLRSTAGLITGAALIMVAVFGGFASGDLISNQQIGFGLAVAVFLDATIVRTVLVPASMRLLGRANWYYPRFLEWVPRVGIEGVAELEPAPAPAGGAE
ncbi:MAG: MMPL family transporter [Chloroflexi bacterium]|nr:MMPL family transporter [Chloroflexota bacterium]